MRCSACGADNPAGAKFCNSCGAAQAVACPQCSQRNPPASRFCNECGHPLAGTPPPAVAVQGPSSSFPERYTPKHLAEKILAIRAPLEGERKQVTVLFADVVGSTELIRDLDPEDAQALLDGAVAVMMDAVHRYEGTVTQTRGDGLMALFGAPLAHEDHAVRACYAALAMQAGIRAYADEAHQRHGMPVQLRAGLNSGEVVVRSIANDLSMEYSAIGQTVHLAARMEQVATTGTVVLTPATLTLVEGYVRVRSLGPVVVKGLAEPVEIHELLGAGPARTRLHAAAARGLSRFVGRQAELEALHTALERAQAGQGQVVALVGEAGVGKSRLVREVTRPGRMQGWTILESGSVSYGQATSWLSVIDLLKAYCRIEARDDERAIREKVTGKVVTLDEGLRPALPALLALLDVSVEDAAWEALDPPQRRRQTLDAVKRLLLRESRGRPLLLVFEDLHWVDSETQALLDSLVESLPSARILLLVNYRPEYRHGWGSKTYYTQLGIDPLPPERADALLQSLLGNDPALRPLKEQLIERTEGNPFFLEETVHTLIETGALVGERGGYRRARPNDALSVPATVQSVLAARIDRLPAEEKRLLQTAAVIGKDVPFALLRAIADVPDDQLQPGLAHLQAAEFLYEAALFPEPEYTFKHALTHEVAYGSLLQTRRRALHARIVDTIEAQYPERLDEHVERLAHHAISGERWEAAVKYGRQAAARAAGRSANREAATHLERALAALQRLPQAQQVVERAIDVRLALRSVLFSLGEMGRSLDHLAEAARLAEGIGDQRRLGRALSQLALTLSMRGAHDKALESGQRALELAEAVDDLGTRVTANLHLGRAYDNLGDYRRGLEYQARNVALLQDEWERERFDLTGYPAVVSRATLARSAAQLGEFARGSAAIEDGIRLGEALDHPYSLNFISLEAGRFFLRRGEPARAITPLERCLGLDETYDFPAFAQDARQCLAAADALIGQAEAAERCLAQVAERAAGGAPALGPLVVRLGSDSVEHILACLLLGRAQEAQELAVGMRSRAREIRQSGLEAWAGWLLGESTAQLDPPDAKQAGACYREALTLAETLGMRPLQAHCHLGLGRLYRRVGRLDEAQAELATAVEMLRSMDMAYWLPQAEAELAEGTTSPVATRDC